VQPQQIDVRGIPMRWLEREGEAELPTVVLVHGIPTTPALWRHVVPRVEGARCLAFEMVGYGDSIPAGRDRDISVARQAQYLLGWLDALEIGRVVYAGHDLGGGVVQIAAVQQPERVAGMMLTNAIGYDSWPIPAVKALRATAPAVERLPDAAFRALIRTFMARGHDDHAMAQESFDVHIGPYLRHGGAAALARQARSLDVRDTLAVASALQGLRVPARIVWGADDDFQKLQYGERLAWDLDAPITRIPGGKHWTPEDHPEPVAAAINELLAAA
jgi:pimeloyl-ACP methyl ester carboxylesterase